ncbi:hypothetical protein HORIV_70790 [Vreelandella olivaria]|uniref:TRAP C4-dicarboxylate transport system permease DctM subunit domain-containing protein n=1 Tax=Vreelandella olivaria TaxID=390919 RepID=A0ABN5XDH0_9GAMM|nr:hypothetical protein HORIV_70790 [Halomonas olivaria]
MGSEAIGAIGLGLLLVLMILRVPVALTMLIVGVVGFAQVISWDAAVAQLKTVPVEVLSNYSFSAVPMFILMGVLAAHSGMAGKLFDSTRIICGGWKGGLAIAAVGSCGIFSAISGSSLATASTMTRVALPEMERYGYNRGLATGALAAGGTLGIMIPPSIALLIYAILTEQSVGDMFMAGLIPRPAGAGDVLPDHYRGDVPAPLSGGSGRTHCLEREAALADRLSAVLWRFPGDDFRDLFWCLYTDGRGQRRCVRHAALRLGKGMRGAQLWHSVQETLALSAVVFFMLVGAETLGYFISVSRISFSITDLLYGMDLTPIVVVLCILALYFVLGMFMDSIAMLVITVPVVYPIIQAMGIDPVWFGILTVLTVELGLMTPPVGMNVFVIKAMAPHVGLGRYLKGWRLLWSLT